MKHKEYIDDTCEIICEDNGRKMVADVISFSKNKLLTVSVERSLKLSLSWNGKVYEGNMGKLSFVSNGPQSTFVKTSR
jgi:hypothetical protein